MFLQFIGPTPLIDVAALAGGLVDTAALHRVAEELAAL